MIDFENMPQLPNVAPDSPIGVAYAHYRAAWLAVRPLQLELATLRSEHETESRRVRVARLCGHNITRAAFDSLADRVARMDELTDRLRPLLAELADAQRDYDFVQLRELERQHVARLFVDLRQHA